MNRVVVTGMGVISPVGNDIENFWNSLIAGKNGVGMITRFDTSDQKVKVAAEVKDFEPTQYIEKAQVRKPDLFTQSRQQYRQCRMQALLPEKTSRRNVWASMSVPVPAASAPSPSSAASFSSLDRAISPHF